MGLFKDFKEFLDLKKGKLFLTNDLYIAELGTITVYEDERFIHSHFDFDRFVIVQRATGEEVNKHLINKYGNFCGKPNMYFLDTNFEKPDRTTYYKLITMNNRIMPTANTKSILDDAAPGRYEVLRKVKTLNGIKKNPNIKFAEMIDLPAVKDLEEFVNSIPEFTM